MTAAAKPLPRPTPDLRLVQNEGAHQSASVFRGPHGQVSIPGLRPAGWRCAREQMAKSKRLSPRESELVTLLLLANGRTLSTELLGRQLFADHRALSQVRTLASRVNARMGSKLIENEWGGFAIPGRFRRRVPHCCNRCNAPVQWDERQWWCEVCGADGELPKAPVIEHGTGRRGYEAGTKQGQPWTEEERAFVLAHLEDMSLEELGEALDRTASAVRGYLATNFIRKKYVRAKKGEVNGETD